VEETPNGFPRLAAFQSSEANFSLYRSFSYLHSRVLLDLQDEITALEAELDDIDWRDHDEDEDRLKSRDFDVRQPDDTRNRRVILREIKAKLMEYGTFLLSRSHTCFTEESPVYRRGLPADNSADEVLIKARTLESFQKPSDRNYRSVRRYCYNSQPLMDDPMESIRSKEDIVSLHNGREWASFDGGVETMISGVDNLLKKVFRTEKKPLQVSTQSDLGQVWRY
jgi:hypothetical protein